ncbi:hypothetical protein WIS52_08120 [Pseudonocardia nematodicida]|uniref:Uncharacterized protein n=1 Tax=Pseudonocardia nematodicida TaxID=1206997 RepID=A0ABV1K7G5_9PSEU
MLQTRSPISSPTGAPRSLRCRPRPGTDHRVVARELAALAFEPITGVPAQVRPSPVPRPRPATG